MPSAPKKLNSDLQWNWAAGCVVGTAVLCLVFAVPELATAIKHHHFTHQSASEWVLEASGAVALLGLLSLAMKRLAVVAVLSLAAAGLAAVHFIDLQDRWDMSSPATWSTLAVIAGLVVLGLCSSVGLRRT